MYHNISIGIVTGLTLIGVNRGRQVHGTLLPMAAKKLRMDPAIMRPR